MTHSALRAWLDAYVEAWRSYDEGAIGELFAESAVYRYHPWDEPLAGRAAIVADWLADRDPDGSWEARYEPAVIEGERAVATGTTRYANGKVYDNVFLLAFDAAGRCAEFTELYAERPGDAG
jgi:SnoaL-like domain